QRDDRSDGHRARAGRTHRGGFAMTSASLTISEHPEADLFDVVIAAPAAGGEETLAVELDAADADALAALAERIGLAPAAIWRAAWAVLLARLAGVRRVRLGGAGAGGDVAIEVPAAGELAPWLIAAATAPPATNGAGGVAHAAAEPAH